MPSKTTITNKEEVGIFPSIADRVPPEKEKNRRGRRVICGLPPQTVLQRSTFSPLQSEHSRYAQYMQSHTPSLPTTNTYTLAESQHPQGMLTHSSPMQWPLLPADFFTNYACKQRPVLLKGVQIAPEVPLRSPLTDPHHHPPTHPLTHPPTHSLTHPSHGPCRICEPELGPSPSLSNATPRRPPTGLALSQWLPRGALWPATSTALWPGGVRTTCTTGACRLTARAS